MLEASSASFIANRYGLGDRATLIGPVARGELGQVWRLITSNGTWAVKEPFEPKSEAESREEAEIQEIARDAGIPAPGGPPLSRWRRLAPRRRSPDLRLRMG